MIQCLLQVCEPRSLSVLDETFDETLWLPVQLQKLSFITHFIKYLYARMQMMDEKMKCVFTPGAAFAPGFHIKLQAIIVWFSIKKIQ